MASHPRKAAPDYPLTRFKELIAIGEYQLVGQQIQRDVLEYNYSPEEIASCLCQLAAPHFDHSEFYENIQKWNDVYFMQHVNSLTKRTHDLYIKFRLNKDQNQVYLLSLHPERPA